MPEASLDAVTVPLSPARVGVDGYTALDRYHDFRAVFFDGGASEVQRSRVLYQLCARCGLHADWQGTDPHEAFRWMGQRSVALWLMACLTAEPPHDYPTETDHG